MGDSDWRTPSRPDRNLLWLRTLPTQRSFLPSFPALWSEGCSHPLWFPACGSQSPRYRPMSPASQDCRKHSPFPHCPRVGLCDQQNMAQVGHSWDKAIEGSEVSVWLLSPCLSLSQITHSGGCWLPCRWAALAWAVRSWGFQAIATWVNLEAFSWLWLGLIVQVQPSKRLWVRTTQLSLSSFLTLRNGVKYHMLIVLSHWSLE